jgi:amino acid transporter
LCSFGNWFRIPINILQSVFLILTVSLITISNGLALSIVAKFKLCYVVCVVILVVVGMVLGQIRTLQKFGWLANLAVFFNVFIMVLTMAVAAHSDPNYTAAGVLSAGATLDNGSVDQLPNGKYPGVQHNTNLPHTGSFVAALNGIMNTVFAYGGANIFTNFLAEMRRPKDFLRAMWCAQAFIWFVYMFYGLFLYGYQGQYSISPAPQTISPYWAIVVSLALLGDSSTSTFAYADHGNRLQTSSTSYPRQLQLSCTATLD